MEPLLIGARTLHFAASLLLFGVFAFECFVLRPALVRYGGTLEQSTSLHRRMDWLTWLNLALALASGAAWLAALGAEMSGLPLLVALREGTWVIVLTRTRFGEVWQIRFAFIVVIAICMFGRRQRLAIAAGLIDRAALLFAALLLAALAWSGHGAATPGQAGELHLAGDILHLLGAGGWLGGLLPLVLLLIEARHRGQDWVSIAAVATRRFSVLAFASVGALLAGGIVNTWFLAGSLPALVGTEYGRLLLIKIALFLVTLAIAAVNLRRLTPRVQVRNGDSTRALVWLHRTALLEGGLGLGVLAIVGLLGTLPPGLHSEPGWPFPVRVDFASMRPLSAVVLAMLCLTSLGCAVTTVATAADGRYRRAAVSAAAGLLCLVTGWPLLRPAVEPAYPTSFYAPARPYAADSVARGAVLYRENCALCHGTDGRGDGPAAAALAIRPANLTEPHLFAHGPGDLFWWVSRGRGNGAMPGFAAVMTPNQRWDVINFVRARAAGVLSQEIGTTVTQQAVAQVPDFAFEAGGAQHMLNRLLQIRPVLLILTSDLVSISRLATLAPARGALAANLIVVALDIVASGEEPPPRSAASSPIVATVAPDVAVMLALFRSPDDGGETELLLDRSGVVRARWTAAGNQLPDIAKLVKAAKTVAQLPAMIDTHAGHAE